MSPANTELIKRALQGDAQAISEIAREYAAVINRIARRIVRNSEDAADITQEALLKLFISLSQLKRPDRFDSWVHSIAYRTSIDWIRAFRRRPTIECDSIGDLPSADEPVDSAMVRKERLGQLLRMIDNLPATYREVLTLYYIEDQPSKRIALRLGIPVGTVRVKLHRGREMLKRMAQVPLEQR